jgi:hypothetical protein
VAAVLAHVEAFKPIAAIKRLFPGAEMVDVPTRGQGGTDLEADSPMHAQKNGETADSPMDAVLKDLP